MPLRIAPWRRLPVLLSLPLAAETTENLCQDPTANREWTKRLAAHPAIDQSFRVGAIRSARQ